MAKKPIQKKLGQRDRVLQKGDGDDKRSAAALRESEARYRAVVEDQTELICRWMPGGILTFVNGAYCRYFGKKSEELIGHSFMPLIPEEDHEKVKRHFAAVGRDNPLSTHEHRVITPNGEIRWQQWINRAIFDGPNRLVEFQSVGRDITERKRIEEALRKSEYKYRLLAENMSDIVWSLDLKGRLTYISPSVKNSLGFTPEEAMELTLDGIFTPASRELVTKNMREVIKQEKLGELGHSSKKLELEYIRKDGSTLWAELVGSALRDESGNMIGFTGVTRDITERKQAEAALKIREKELEIKSRTLEETNAALKLILKKREEDRSELEENVLSNIRELVMPYIEKMKTRKMDKDQETFISVIESNLNDIISAFLPRQPEKYLALTPTEIQISNLIKQGKHSKDIAVLMNLSKRTIDVHRDNIRRKLGIKGTATNLRSYLLSLR